MQSFLEFGVPTLPANIYFSTRSDLSSSSNFNFTSSAASEEERPRDGVCTGVEQIHHINYQVILERADSRCFGLFWIESSGAKSIIIFESFGSGVGEEHDE